jgi:hypothetical protein
VVVTGVRCVSRVGETERLVCTRSCNAQTVEVAAANSERVVGHSENPRAAAGSAQVGPRPVNEANPVPSEYGTCA